MLTRYIIKWGGAYKPLLIITIPSEKCFIQDCVNGILNMPPHHISCLSDTTLHNIAEIFHLKLDCIYHESVQNEHIDFYKSTTWAKCFLPTPLVDRGLLRKIINKAEKVGKHFITIPPNTYGYTVIATYSPK